MPAGALGQSPCLPAHSLWGDFTLWYPLAAASLGVLGVEQGSVQVVTTAWVSMPMSGTAGGPWQLAEVTGDGTPDHKGAVDVQPLAVSSSTNRSVSLSVSSLSSRKCDSSLCRCRESKGGPIYITHVNHLRR